MLDTDRPSHGRSLALREAMPVRRTGNPSLAIMEIVRLARLSIAGPIDGILDAASVGL